MFYRLILIFILATLPCEGTSGPWLHEKGSSFTAVSLAATYTLETTTQTYIEYGFGNQMTLIGDINLARRQYLPGTGAATFSFRRALSAADAPAKWAYEIGIGASWDGAQTQPHIRTALSWGRGTTWGERSGWVTVEGAMIWDLAQAAHVAKLDTTIGVSLGDKSKGMLQLYTAHMGGKITATLAPSFIFKPESTKFSVLIGAESRIGQLDDTALKFGIWRDF